MKIGILTLPIAENYGGILQAVALYRFLHAHGHDVVLIYKMNHKVLWKRIVISILLKLPFPFFKDFKVKHNMRKEWKKRKEFHRTFIDKEIFRISKDLYTKKDLEDFVKQEKFDAVIVGSDQVWRKLYINDKYYQSYFLDFVDGNKTKKIAYAASFGKDYWEGTDDIEDISQLLKNFSAVSTREASGVDICRDSFGYSNALHVLDPTLLMGKEFYEDIIANYDVSSITKGGLVTYVLDEVKEKKEIINFVKQSTSTESVYNLKGFNSSKITYSVPQWLASFAYADFVLTDSFHGMIFSIIFEKEFLVIGNYERGLDRFISLLSLLGLEDRLVFSMKDMNDKKLNTIDYTSVNKILEEIKKSSLEFLVSSLNSGM